MAAEAKTKPERSAEKRREVSAARDYLQSLVVAVILALYATTFLVQAFKIPSGSMEDTLLVGDHLMVDKVSYAPANGWARLLPYRPIERGQIIIFRHPDDPGTYLVKRVIGLPGDRIQLRQKQVYRNGQALDESYVLHNDPEFNEFRDNFPNFASGLGLPAWMEQLPSYVHNGELVVPAGQYFVMGDNRDLSSDSRYWGFVPRENIVGQPLVLYWSVESTSEDYQQTSAAGFTAQALDLLIHFPQKTRWNRMLRLVH